MNQGKDLSKYKVKRIQWMLEHTELSMVGIANAVGCSPGPVNAINRRYGIRQYGGRHGTWVLKKAVLVSALMILCASSALADAKADRAASVRAALTLGPSSNAYVKKVVLAERRFWFDKALTEYCLTWDQQGVLGVTQRVEICMPSWDAAFESVPLARPVIDGQP